jgi:phage tail sheath protein FI
MAEFLARTLVGSTPLGNLLQTRASAENTLALTGGTDGDMPTTTEFTGVASDSFLDYVGDPIHWEKNGLLAFEGVEDISILASPGYTSYTADVSDLDPVYGIQNALINHCEAMRYRIAVLDTPPDYLATQALTYRNQRSSTHAAIYYPWVFVSDVTPGTTRTRLKLPPSGFIAGIYARNDIENAVFKAPANEVIRLAIDFEQRLNKAHQELLNPEGVNCLRFFEGRGYLVWGARTISDDPEWKYVSIRRYFAYLEHSIERGTQWVVFENNGPALWQNVRQTIDDFLFNEWKMGAMIGEKPETSYFVRCDLSTMTQNDLDNGRLICLIGVAPVKPAEFVIFRIGQWTASKPQ